MEAVIIIAAIGCFIGLFASAWVTISVMKYIDKIGDLPELKTKTISRSLFNFYSIIALMAVILSRSLNFIEDQLFIGLLVAILAGLGFKITAELFQK